MAETIERDVMEYDVLIVGGGPAGLACAISLKQRKPDLTVCVLEKASAIGAQALSGAVLEPGPLDALLPLTRTGRIRLPTPPQQHNEGNFIVSLGLLMPQIAAHAEQLGVDVIPGFAAAKPLFNDDGSVAGVQIGDMGIEKSGEIGPNYAPGPEVRARVTILAEGCRGSVSKQLIQRYQLDADCDLRTRLQRIVAAARESR